MAKQQNPTKYDAIDRPRHQSLVEIAYEVLLEAIIDQKFEPGSQISIDSLAKQLHMSNTPIREALMQANGEGLVRQKTNHGFVVAPLLTPIELHQLFEVRHVLEVYATGSAIITSEAIEELNRIIEQMRRATDGAVYGDYKDYLLLDHEFHRTLVAMEGNPFLLKTWEDLHVHLHLSRLYTGVGLIDRDDSVKEHQDIFEAVQRSDNSELTILVSHHIKRVEKRVETFLDR